MARPHLAGTTPKLAYLMCKDPQKAVDTFHAITGIAWPELPPWPEPSLPKARGHKRSVSSKKRRQLERTTMKGVDPYKSVPMPSNMTLRRDELGRFPNVPAEFLELKAGPAHAEDDSAPLEMTTEERGAMAGERFLQLREAGSMGAEAPALAPGPYVGNCRPNALLVATVVKAHGRRRRLDDACRAVQRMEDWGLRPDAAVFNSLAAAAAWNGRLDLALEVRCVRDGGAWLQECWNGASRLVHVVPWFGVGAVGRLRHRRFLSASWRFQRVCQHGTVVPKL